jgi:hypothetical protein
MKTIGVFTLCCSLYISDIQCNNEVSSTVDRALSFSIVPTDNVESEVVDTIIDAAFKQVMNCEYEAALAIILDGLEQYPSHFDLQSNLAALIGDYSETCSGELKETLAQKSQALFNQLLEVAEHQPKYKKHQFKNEYFFRHAQYKNQYENGLELIARSQLEEIVATKGKGYYYQGVGAARHAQQLVTQGNKVLSCEYAHKAIISWAQYFTYENDYYNAYVHYALALGILGYIEDMVHALLRSASFINKDLSYFEFQDVIDFLKIDHAKAIL